MKIRPLEVIRPVFFFYTGIVIAALAWRYQEQTWLIALLPVVWALTRARADGFFLFFGYYLMFAIDAPNAFVKFGEPSSLYGHTLWVGHAALLSLPWFVFMRSKWKQAALVLLMTALPPFGAFNWGHPLLAAGEFFPDTRLLGLALCYGMMVWGVWVVGLFKAPIPNETAVKMFAMMPALWFSFISASQIITYSQSESSNRWVAINTTFGSINQGLMPSQRHQLMAKSAKQEEGVGSKVIVFAEEVGGEWLDTKLTYWHEIRNSQSVVIVGADVRLSDDEFLNAAVDARTGNVIASARVPMPAGNWKLAGPSSNHHLFSSNVKTIQNRKVSFIFCFEESLVYPLAFDAANGAQTIISMANLWSVKDAPARKIQRHSIELQAKLYGLPLIRAENI